MRGPNTDDDWPIWRLVLKSIATLHEIESHWTISDVLDANEALDVEADVDEWHRKRDAQQRERDRIARAAGNMRGRW